MPRGFVTVHAARWEKLCGDVWVWHVIISRHVGLVDQQHIRQWVPANYYHLARTILLSKLWNLESKAHRQKKHLNMKSFRNLKKFGLSSRRVGKRRHLTRSDCSVKEHLEQSTKSSTSLMNKFMLWKRFRCICSSTLYKNQMPIKRLYFLILQWKRSKRFLSCSIRILSATKAAGWRQPSQTQQE